jgi:1,4-alpha-glucan branching enzyme
MLAPGSRPSSRRAAKGSALNRLSIADRDAIVEASHREPRSVLGYHESARAGKAPLAWVRVLEPDAAEVLVFWEDESVASARPLKRVHAGGLFEGELRHRRPLVPYRLRVRYASGHEIIKPDPYYFAPQLSEFDLHLFGEGNHYRIWAKLGAHPATLEGIAGTRFAVWAPNAERVSVVGAFNLWDGRRHALQARGTTGVWELFVPGVGPGTAYKYEIRSRAGGTRLKSDPYAFAMQMRPDNCSIVAALEGFTWHDGAWLEARARDNPRRRAINAYEVHLASWRRPEGREPPFLTWDEAARELIPYVQRLGFTHIELMGVAEHPFDGSWGYQVAGYYAPTARYGTPDDFRRFVDGCHLAGLGVLMDWVPAHFPKDEHGLADFDGSALYEHADPRQGEHRGWGTKVFNFGRNEVRNFLVANALYWLEQFHIDGLRVDAVASMLYLDYDRPAGEWIPNAAGGRENQDAIGFLRQLNWAIGEYAPGTITLAEESTTFPGVTLPVSDGGLGFTFKWNMGWMNDTLRYFSLDPLFRSHEHRLVTFSFVYAWSESFLLPISHDEVVHGKRALLDKMPGDEWQKRANYRLLRTYMTAHPGKKLLFMGSEFGQWHEWRDGAELDWALLDHTGHRALSDFNAELNGLYARHAALHGSDADREGFAWLEVDNAAQSVFAFERRATRHDGGAPLVCIFNATPVPRDDYWVGVEAPGSYVTLIDSDAPRFGGSGYARASEYPTTARRAHGRPYAIKLALPPLGALILTRR